MAGTREIWYSSVIVTALLTVFTLYLDSVTSMDVKPQKERYVPDYTVYHNLSMIGQTIQKFVKRHPKLVTYFPQYTSRHGRSQYVIRVTNLTTVDSISSSRSKRTKVLLSFGEHPREFLPLESLVYLLKRISKSFHNDLKINHREIDFNAVDLYVIVNANPDGRSYVEERSNYCWRGTTSGVDINRNFDWEFGGKGSSNKQTDEEYRGPYAFSEPECRVYTDLTETVAFDAFISLHSGIRQIYLPFADTVSQATGREPTNLSEMFILAQRLSTATKHHYEFGMAGSLNNYTADGTVFDYMAGVRKIPFSYAIELSGPDNYQGSSCFDLFNPPNQQLQTIVEEIYPMYTTLFDYLIKWKRKSQAPDPSNNKRIAHSSQPEFIHSINVEAIKKQTEVPSLTPGYVLLLVLVLGTVLASLYGRYPVCKRIYQRRRVVSLRALSSSFSTSIFSR